MASSAAVTVHAHKAGSCEPELGVGGERCLFPRCTDALGCPTRGGGGPQLSPLQVPTQPSCSRGSEPASVGLLPARPSGTDDWGGALRALSPGLCLRVSRSRLPPSPAPASSQPDRLSAPRRPVTRRFSGTPPPRHARQPPPSTGLPGAPRLPVPSVIHPLLSPPPPPRGVLSTADPRGPAGTRSGTAGLLGGGGAGRELGSLAVRLRAADRRQPASRDRRPGGRGHLSPPPPFSAEPRDVSAGLGGAGRASRRAPRPEPAS